MDDFYSRLSFKIIRTLFELPITVGTKVYESCDKERVVREITSIEITSYGLRIEVDWYNIYNINDLGTKLLLVDEVL